MSGTYQVNRCATLQEMIERPPDRLVVSSVNASPSEWRSGSWIFTARQEHGSVADAGKRSRGSRSNDLSADGQWHLTSPLTRIACVWSAGAAGLLPTTEE